MEVCEEWPVSGIVCGMEVCEEWPVSGIVCDGEVCEEWPIRENRRCGREFCEG